MNLILLHLIAFLITMGIIKVFYLPTDALCISLRKH